MPTTWFIPAPDDAIAQRVTLTLRMGAARRYFRQVAVPGIGGALFVRHCSWAVAALALRDAVPQLTPSRIANGLEALACKFNQDMRAPEDREGRIRGVRAFAHSPDAWSFRELSQPRNYVHITFRQSVVTALTSEAGLGFTTGGRRFNAMTLTTHGTHLAEAFLGQTVGTGSGALRRPLLSWLMGADETVTRSVGQAIAPWPKPAPETELFLARLLADHAEVHRIGTRARARLMEIFSIHGVHEEPPLAEVLTALRASGNESHALALEAAVAFETLFSTAQRVVHVAAERLESLDLPSSPLTELASGIVEPHLRRLQTCAQTYQQTTTRADVRHSESDAFARDLTSLTSLDAALRTVINRDGQVLALGDAGIARRGILFSSWRPIVAATTDSAVDTGLRSPRLLQAYRLWKDCHGTGA